MTPAELRDAIIALAQDIAKRSTSPTVDQWAAELEVLAGTIPTLAPTIIERRQPNSDRRQKDDLMAVRGRRNGARRRGPPTPGAAFLTDLIVVAPDNLIVGVTAQATVQAIMRGITVLGTTDQTISGVSVTWSSTDTGVATIDSSTGVITPVSAGTTTIRATAQGITGSDTCTVVTPTPTLSSLTIAPVNPTVAASATQQFSASALWSDGTTNVPTLTWSKVSGVGSIDSAGLYTAPGSSGSAVIKVENGAISNTTTVTVAAPAATLSSLTVVPDAPTLEITQSQQFAVTALWSDNTTTIPTVAWAVVSGPGSIDSAGLYTAGSSTGSAVIRATSGAVSDTTTVTVTAPPPPPVTLQSLTLSPATVTVQVNATQQFVTTAAWTDGSTVLPGDLAYSIVSGAGVIDSSGLFTAGGSAGTTVVQVASAANSQSDTSTITVNTTGAPPTLFSEDWSGYANDTELAAAWSGGGLWNRNLSAYFGGYSSIWAAMGNGSNWRAEAYKLITTDPVYRCVRMGQWGHDLYTFTASNTNSTPTGVVTAVSPNGAIPKCWVHRRIRFNTELTKPTGYTSISGPGGFTSANTGWDNDNSAAFTNNAWKCTEDLFLTRNSWASGQGFIRIVLSNGTGGNGFRFTDNIPAGATTTLLSPSAVGIGVDGGRTALGCVRPFALPVNAGSVDDGWYDMVEYFNRLSSTECIVGFAVRRTHDGNGNAISLNTQEGYWRTVFTRVQGVTPPDGLHTFWGGQNTNHTFDTSQFVFWGPMDIYDAGSVADPLGILARYNIVP